MSMAKIRLLRWICDNTRRYRIRNKVMKKIYIDIALTFHDLYLHPNYLKKFN